MPAGSNLKTKHLIAWIVDMIFQGRTRERASWNAPIEELLTCNLGDERGEAAKRSSSGLASWVGARPIRGSTPLKRFRKAEKTYYKRHDYLVGYGLLSSCISFPKRNCGKSKFKRDEHSMRSLRDFISGLIHRAWTQTVR